MIELTRSNDPVLLSFVESLMTEAGIPVVIADGNISIMEGSIGAFPRRVLVDPEHVEGARELLAEAELDIATPPR